jgi:hypothetical protein
MINKTSGLLGPGAGDDRQQEQGDGIQFLERDHNEDVRIFDFNPQ